MGNSGLHNILEPAIFKNPILIGKNYINFPEAKDLISKNGAISVKDSKEFENILVKLNYKNVNSSLVSGGIATIYTGIK